MTSYSYSFVFDDGEMLVLRKVLSDYLTVCEKEIANGATAPFIAEKMTIEGLFAKFDKESERTTSEHPLGRIIRAGKKPPRRPR